MRLQQHRVHRDARLGVAGARLQRLGAADLAAIRRHRRVVRHVLRLKRQHLEPVARQRAGKARKQQRLADIGAGALQHERGRAAAL